MLFAQSAYRKVDFAGSRKKFVPKRVISGSFTSRMAAYEWNKRSLFDTSSASQKHKNAPSLCITA